MPSWWLEATVPGLVFGTMLIVWIVIPARPGQTDLGLKVRDHIRRLVQRGR
jgi:hypothetical protein